MRNNRHVMGRLEPFDLVPSLHHIYPNYSPSNNLRFDAASNQSSSQHRSQHYVMRWPIGNNKSRFSQNK
jgi:hypothetical protein